MIFLFLFFFFNLLSPVYHRGQPVPRLHQLATYMKFVLSLATLPKEKGLRRNIHDKSRFDIRAIMCRRDRANAI